MSQFVRRSPFLTRLVFLATLLVVSVLANLVFLAIGWVDAAVWATYGWMVLGVLLVLFLAVSFLRWIFR